MIKRRRFPKIFFGWWTVLTSGVLMFWGMGYYLYGFSALFKPIASELGFTRAATSVAASIGRFEGGFEAPLTGWITDKYGPRGIVLVGIFLVGLGLVLMSFINSLWAFYLVWGVITATGTNIGLTLPLDVAISNWFVKKRGLAQGTKWVVAGLSGMAVLPLIAWLIATQGWRTTVVIGGVVMWVVGLPLAWFFLKPHRPEYYGLLPDGATVAEEATGTDQMIEKGVKYAAEVQEVEFTLRQAIRTPAYWLLIVAQSSHSLATPVFFIHGIPFLTDIGMDPLKAAGMMAMMVGVSIPFRLIGGFLGDRAQKNHLRFLLGGTYLLQAIGFAVFLQNQTIAMIYAWFILYGIGFGTSQPLNPVVRTRYFGRKAIGSIAGISTMLMVPVGVAAPIYLGWVYDTTGSYITGFILVAALLAFAGIFMSFILPPKPPAVVTDIHKIM